MNPLISVIIPTYNHAHFLGRALQSLLDQTYSNWEAIIIDNYSEDGTEIVIENFKDPRIQHLKFRNNGVIAASRNKGIFMAKGEWIAFLDSDDWWTSDKLQCCILGINPGVDFLYHDLKIIREKASFFQRDNVKSRQLKSPVLRDLLVNDNAISNSSVVVRKKLLDKIGGLSEDKTMIGSEDFNAWLRIAKLTDNFLYIPKFLGFYQIHGTGISSKEMTGCYIAAITDFLSEITPLERNKINSTLTYMRGKYYFLNKQFDIALRELNSNLTNGEMRIRLKSLYIITLILISKVLLVK